MSKLMIPHYNNRSSDDDTGAVVVEFALILPFLLLLVFGIISFGAVYNSQIALQGAAREGARALALGNDPVAAANGATGIDITVSTLRSCPVDPDEDDFATVQTSRDVDFRIPFFSFDTLNLMATASMRCGL